jgi:hypothetical protein
VSAGRILREEVLTPEWLRSVGATLQHLAANEQWFVVTLASIHHPGHTLNFEVGAHFLTDAHGPVTSLRSWIAGTLKNAAWPQSPALADQVFSPEWCERWGVVEVERDPAPADSTIIWRVRTRGGHTVRIATTAATPLEDARLHIEAGLIRLKKAALPQPDYPVSPDLMEYVLGYRQWSLIKDAPTGHLVGLGAHGWGLNTWEGPAEIRATCGFAADIGDPSHTSPHPECECGLYARHWLGNTRPDGYSRWVGAADSDSASVWGAVLARGRMEVHADGFRAEYMRPLALLAETEVGHAFALPSFTDPDDLTAYAKKHGRAIPTELFPEPPLWGSADPWSMTIPNPRPGVYIQFGRPATLSP